MDKKTTMENLARALQEKDGFNGAWFYAEGGEIVSKGGLGFRAPEDRVPITEDSIFQLASVCKNFTAAAPAIPSSGNPPRPKMNSGSRAMLTAAPAICAIIGVFISPFA